MVLRRRGYSVSPSTAQPGHVIFSPHSRTGTVPVPVIGQKRPRPDSQESASTGDDLPQAAEDEIHVSFDLPTQQNARRNAADDITVRVKAGPADYYCSFVCSPSTSSVGNIPQRRLLMIAEAKAPHKLTRELINEALGNNTTIDTTQFIEPAEHQQPDLRFLPSTNTVARTPLNISHTSSDDENRNANAQRWLAAVSAQIYTVLIDKEIRYGYITTGESYILVRLRPGHATTMEYLLLPALRPQPTREVDGEAAWLTWLAATPLSRITCLALLSQFGNAKLTQDELDEVETAAVIWKSPRHREISLETGSHHSAATEKSRGSDPEWTEQEEQHGRKRTRADGDHFAGEPLRETKRPRVSTPITPPTSQSPLKHSGKVSQQTTPYLSPPLETHDGDKTGDTIHLVPFCSARCLRSIASSAASAPDSTTHVDTSCPNYQIHQQHFPPSASHLRSLAQQIELPTYLQDPSYEEDPPTIGPSKTNAVYLNMYGANSALFKVRIEGGYVLVAEAAMSSYPDMEKEMLGRLKKEARIYRKLRPLQGHDVPVCLGVVDLSKGDGTAMGRSGFSNKARFSAFLLLSWAGRPLALTTSDVDLERVRLGQVREDLKALVERIHGRGVHHGDAALRNLVVCPGQGRDCLTVVDFERATSSASFSRRLARKYPGVSDEKADQTFQDACEKEHKAWMCDLDRWVERTLETLQYEENRATYQYST
ncbi:hypothetical protein F5883DRAFT_573084 [Diaporthe sp. PMI_573]|nr:hypothetical protein F5883DRAFT_573084 [Diaporthaceae sp. PMI_573]